MTTAAPADLLAAVDDVAPIIRAHAAEAEAQRRIPSASYQAMEEAGLFTMLAPKAHGGRESHPVEALQVWEALARIDPAHAWNCVMNQAIAAYVAWLPAAGAAELMADGPTTVAGALNPPVPATRDAGGWRLTGQVPVASGCHNARWLAMPAVEMDGSGPKLDPTTGQPTPMGMFLPAEEAEIVDTWHTLGMRGTGSADIKVVDVFVPDHRVAPVAPLQEPAPGFEGPLFRMWPWTAILGESITSVAIATSAVDELVALAPNKTPAYEQVPIAHQQLMQATAGQARARVEASRDTLYRAAEQAYDQVNRSGELLSVESKLRLQLACAFAADACREALRLVTDAAGTASVRLSQPFERHLRDIHTLSHHSSKSLGRYASAGRLMFGQENDWVWLSF